MPELIVREIDAKSVLSKSGIPVCDYAANPYVGCPHACRYCYASFMKRFTGHTEPWGAFVDVKRWPAIKRPERYRGKKIFVGSVTDPYNPLEARCERTRALLTQLQGSGAHLSIATKSDLVLRDLDLIKAFPNARVSWSINTLDESFKADMDKAVSIERRLAAMKAFHDAGVRTTCFISPIFPGITNVPAIIERARRHCNLIWLENLNLRGDYKPVVMAYIAERHPRLLPLYRDIYTRKDYSYWADLDEHLNDYAARVDLDYVANDDSLSRPFEAPPLVVNFFYHERIVRRRRSIDSLPTGRDLWYNADPS